MKLRKNWSATDVLLFLALCLASAIAFAAEAAGTVINLSGPLLARKADGTVKILSHKSAVEEGDTLITEKDTYARIRLIDNSEITLRPSSQLKIDSFAFDEARPENDSAIFNLVKGGLRAVTGALGKRSKERFGMHTPTATIGIRGTIFIAEYVPPAQPAVAGYGHASVAAASVATSGAGTLTDMPPVIAPLAMLALNEDKPSRLAQASGTEGAGVRPAGLYVQVLDGMVNLSNSVGTQDFAAGQFGYAASLQQPPVLLPANPGMQFTPPASFTASTSSTTAQGGQGGQGDGKAFEEVNCEVR